MTIPTISTLPTAPARTDPPATFVTRADSFLAALVVMQGELNTSIGQMNADFITIGNNVTAAQAAQTAAEVAQAAAETAKTNAEIAETNAETAQTGAETALSSSQAVLTQTQEVLTSTEAVYDAFDDRYLGAKANDPTLDNDGNALQTGAQYFNTTNDVTRVYNGSAWQDSAAIATSVTLSQVTDFPSQSGQSGKYLSTNGTVPSWETLTTDPTLGTLTKTFAQNETASINLTSSVLAPVVSVTKEVPQSGVTNNSWDVNSTTENYTRLDSAYATTLDWAVKDVSTASYSQNFFVASQDASPSGIAFNADGTKMFVAGQGGDAVYEYTLSTGFDISTANFVDSFSVSAQASGELSLCFNSDGTKMFVTDSTGDDVNEYTLSTSFDVSTASYSQNFSLSGQGSFPLGIAFNTDGTQMFICDYSGAEVNEYTLGTGFDISTASYSQRLDVSAQASGPSGIGFNADGTKMFVTDYTGASVSEYTLSSSFDISTATFVAALSVSAQDANPYGIAFNTDKTKMFIVGFAGDDVIEYTLPLSLQLGTGSFASADVGKTIEANSGEFVLTATDGSFVETTAPTSYDQVASGSWSMYGVVYNAADGDLELSSVTDPASLFDVSTASFVQSFSVSAQEGLPRGMTFSSDGTKMFVCGTNNDSVNEYTLSTAFDVSTANFTQSVSVAAQETAPEGIAFNNDGTKMFIVGPSGDDVNEYTLSTAFDVSTISFVDSFGVSAQDSQPIDIAFNNTGTKMFIVGLTGRDINEYTLSTGFDVSSASFVDSFSVAAQETNPTGVAFSSDGTKMFVVGEQGDDVNEYTLATGFDVSTASFVDSFSIAAQEGNVSSIRFSNEGSKMFVLGVANDSVNEYSIGSLAIPTGYHPVHTTASIDSTYWTDINSMTADQAAGDGNVYYAISTDDRTTWTVIDNTDGERDIVRNNAGTWQYNSNGTYALETWVNGTTNTELATLAEAMEGASYLVNPFDVSASVFVDSFSVASEETSPVGVTFNTDGSKMFVAGNAGDDVNEYALSTAFDVTTASFVDSFSFASQDTNIQDITFNSDGTLLFVIGIANDAVYSYTLSTAFDVSTAVYSQNFSVSSQSTDGTAIVFNADGTKMFVADYFGNVNEYTLSTGFDISTASYSQNFSVSAKEPQVQGLAFNTDGTKMFVVGDSSDSVHEYLLSTGFDVSTSSFSQTFSVASQDLLPRGMCFNSLGNKMFIVGTTNTSVYQYSTATTSYPNQMDKTQLDAVTDPNHIALGNDLDLAIVFNMTSGSTVPSSDGVAINYDANVLNKGAVLGTDYDFDAPTQSSVRITALAANNLKVRVV